MNVSNSIAVAAARIAEFTHKTPVLNAPELDKKLGCQVFFKCENLQRTGAFKARGATNAVFALSEEQAQYGVATHSSGNHGKALAYAAGMRGIPAYIVMPSNAPEIKKKGVLEYGGKIIECPPTLADRERYCERVIHTYGAHFIHPFDNADVISGQGTCAHELFEQTDSLDVLMVPVGGGGLLGGSILCRDCASPNTAVIACEPEGADDAYRSWRAKKLIPQTNPQTIADGLRTSMSDRTFELMMGGVREVLTCSETRIRQAHELVMNTLKIIIEPSCAVPMACLLSKPDRFEGKRIGMILSGGNYDFRRENVSS
jgi:threonine dehydratase